MVVAVRAAEEEGIFITLFFLLGSALRPKVLRPAYSLASGVWVVAGPGHRLNWGSCIYVCAGF